MSRATSSRSSIAATTAGSSGASDIYDAGTAVEQLPDHLIGRDAVGLRLKVHQHAMAQHRQRDGAHIVERRHAAAVDQRRAFAPSRAPAPRADRRPT